jgi:hypothetical protein
MLCMRPVLIFAAETGKDERASMQGKGVGQGQPEVWLRTSESWLGLLSILKLASVAMLQILLSLVSGRSLHFGCSINALCLKKCWISHWIPVS